jgi:hypothetical protein
VSGQRAVTLSALFLLVGGAFGCRQSPRAEAPLHLNTSAAGSDTRLTLLAGPHLKINARLAPALELAGGSVLRFSARRLTPDSAYFAEPPSALLAGRHPRVHGTLHASVCGVDEQVCRSVTVALD